jgi:hypothetical protein
MDSSNILQTVEYQLCKEDGRFGIHVTAAEPFTLKVCFIKYCLLQILLLKLNMSQLHIGKFTEPKKITILDIVFLIDQIVHN